MFKKVLIANRGEIALRVIWACKDLGLKTVAVYSEADRESLHVRFADQAVCIGPPRNIESYLNIPAILKASAGGGGRGMRIVRAPAEVPAAFRAAQAEAQAAFGVPDVYLERYVEAPRHIEIQVMGDTRGNVVHLGERECSIQRRHQ